jgi:SAM-dependent methyltransferase
MTPKPATSAEYRQAPAPPAPTARKYIEYPGKDLDAMAFASNYRRWIMEMLMPFIGRRIVEVGAGTGSFSELFLATKPENLTVLEPSPNLHSRLTSHLPLLAPAGNLKLLQSTFTDALADGIGMKARSFDTAVYINVLEHIEEDEAELSSVFEALPSGGRILIFVPALSFLMSPMDREMGHFRRYSLQDLKTKCLSAGFSVPMARYFDVLGIVPWWIKFRLLKSTQLGPEAVRMHDRFVVPISRALENLATPPCGKNIILIGEKG